MGTYYVTLTARKEEILYDFNLEADGLCKFVHTYL